MKDDVKISLRIDEDVMAKIKFLAKIKNISLNKEIVSLVQEFVEDYEKKNGKIKSEHHDT